MFNMEIDMVAIRIVVLLGFLGWILFWWVFITSPTQAAYPQNVKSDKQVQCESIGGAYNYKASKNLTIDCLTKTHAIFNSKDDLVNYMRYYKNQFDQAPAIFLED